MTTRSPAKRVTKTIVPTAKKRAATVARVAAPTSKLKLKAKPKAAGPVVLGMTDFTRSVKSALERSSEECLEVIFGTPPQIHFLPASENEDEVDDVPEKRHISVTQLRARPLSYRTLVRVGIDFVVSSGAHKVLMKRHPKFDVRTIEPHMKDYRDEALTDNERMARRHAFKASRGTAEIMEFLQRATAEQEVRDSERAARDAEQQARYEETVRQNDEIIELLTKVMENGTLTAEQRATLVRFQNFERVRIAQERENGRKRLANERDLPRTEVGTN
jgi:hypothetical protein